MLDKKLILASASPRRRELLDQIGIHYSIQPADICEDVLASETPTDYVNRMALEKAQTVYSRLADTDQQQCVVLGSDTTVVRDNFALGKPANQAEAQAMLMSLSGRCHQVMTAIALVGQGIEEVMCVTTDVEFRELTANDCARYWATGEPVDKAGGYGIQGFGAVFVSGIKGSYSGVVGLPLAETAQLLSKYNIPVWQSK